MSLVVVRVADVGGGDEHLERVLLIDLHFACFNLLVQLFHLLLSVAGESELLFVAPENIWSGFHSSLGQHVMENNDLPDNNVERGEEKPHYLPGPEPCHQQQQTCSVCPEPPHSLSTA